MHIGYIVISVTLFVTDKLGSINRNGTEFISNKQSHTNHECRIPGGIFSSSSNAELYITNVQTVAFINTEDTYVRSIWYNNVTYFQLQYPQPLLSTFYPRDAMHKRGYCCRRVSVWMSVCHTPVLYRNG